MILPVAGMVELADTSDLGSDELSLWRFESSYPYQAKKRAFEESKALFSIKDSTCDT